MKKKILLLAVFMIAMIPTVVKAEPLKEADEKDLVAQTTKYYKTITKKNNLALMSATTEPTSYSIEISKEEYDSVDPNAASIQGDVSTETNYKRMTTSIYKNGNYYQYKNVVNWKTMPSVRSHDIIAIGMLSNVKIASSLFFEQYYCTSSGCGTSNTNTPKTFSTGGGTVFQLKTGSLTTLRETLYFNVSKNTTATITGQYAYGDYAHSTKTISLANASNFNVGTSGISFNSYGDYFDEIQANNASWSGSW